ncbi:MAG TPA: AI-2E family transporter [Aggregatilineales bacterium]|nr:AI-2E family transporter [Anaerolineae bacterium]HUN08159.1 AI-2E family transporter [Aggregatilineales bacterium]
MVRLSGESSGGQITRWVITAFFTLILLLAAWQVRSTLLLFLAAIIVVVLLTIPIRWLQKLGMKNRTGATLISLALFIAVIMLLFLLALPTLLEQFGTLAQDVQRGIEEAVALWNQIQAAPEGDALREQNQWIVSLQTLVATVFRDTSLNELINTISGQLSTAIGRLSSSVLPVVGGVASTLLSVLIVLFLSLYLLANPREHEDAFIKLFPIPYRHRVRFIIDRIDFTLRLWLEGQLLLMVIVGVLTAVLLGLLGIEQAVALGVMAGVFSFVPNFGPIAALVPALAVGFVQAPQSIGWIIVIIYGTSFLQSQVIAPLIFKQSINLPPVLVLMGQIFAAVFLGFIGIMLAVPIIAILMILVQEVYIKDVLGDRPPEERVSASLEDAASPV